MKFLCGSCRTKYQISDEKVRGKILTIRCKKCGAKVVIRESLAKAARGKTVVAPLARVKQSTAKEEAEPAPAASTARAAASSQTDASQGQTQPRQSTQPRMGGAAALASALDDALTGIEGSEDLTSIAPTLGGGAPIEWFIAIDGKQSGPFAFAEVSRKVRAGEINGGHYVWHDPMDEWKKVEDLPDVAALLPKGEPPPPPQEGSGTEIARGIQGAAGIGSSVVDAQGVGSDDVGLTADLGTGDLISFEGDDLFAGVPRASEQEQMSRESTRFFVAAAGVQGQKSRNRIGRLLGAGLIGAALLFVALGFMGVIRIDIPGIGNPFEGFSSERDLYSGEVEDPEALRSALTPEQRKRRRALKRRRKAPDPEGFIEDGQETGAGGTRAGSAETVGIDEAMRLDKAQVEKLPEHALPQSDLSNVPVPDLAGNISPKEITRVVNQRKKSVNICYKQSLRANDNLRGKLYIEVKVMPSGRVAKASVQTPEFKGTKLARCVTEKIKDWRFPQYNGEPQVVVVPFVLERSAF